jgi:hypothetical protein
MGSDFCAIANYATCAYRGALANLDVFAEDGARADGDILSELCRRWDNCRWMDAAATVLGVVEKSCGSGESEARLAHDQQRLAGRRLRGELSGDDSGRFGSKCGVEMLLVFDEDDAFRGR